MRQSKVTPSAFRHSALDATLVGVALLYGAVLVAAPSAPLMALGFWWIANTVAHNFIHLPFFRSRVANSTFSIYLSLLLGLPQTMWRDRHLAHHADRAWKLRWSNQLGIELLAIATLWSFIALQGAAFLMMCAVGWSAGLALCWMQGYFEHIRGTVSHYGWLYNVLFFNDGFHVEHHERPGLHWSTLGSGQRAMGNEASRWPAILRWLEFSPLNGLERIALRSRALQRFMVDRHVPAFRRLLNDLPNIRRVTIVGGGLFPRTALVLRRILPDAEITILDKSAESLSRAMPYLEHSTRIVEASYSPELCGDTDLVIVPLAFVGGREMFYATPPAPAVIVHDWIWNRRGQGAIVSPLLLKRVNLVRA